MLAPTPTDTTVPVTRGTHRLVALAVAAFVLAFSLGAVMTERCLVGDGSGPCCPGKKQAALVSASECVNCMAPSGPEIDSAEVSPTWFAKSVPLAALSMASSIGDLSNTLVTARRVPFRSDPVPLTLKIRVLRI